MLQIDLHAPYQYHIGMFLNEYFYPYKYLANPKPNGLEQLTALVFLLKKTLHRLTRYRYFLPELILSNILFLIQDIFPNRYLLSDLKLLTKEEYFDRINTIARSKNSEDRVNLISDRAMLSYRNIETTIFIGVFLELILGGVTYYLYSQSDNYGWILIIMVVLGVIFDIASSVFMMI